MEAAEMKWESWDNGQCPTGQLNGNWATLFSFIDENRNWVILDRL